MNSESEHTKSTFKNALIYSSASILGKAVGFIMLPIYAHYLRAEGYGIISMIDIVISMLALFIGYGLSGAFRRLYFEKETKETKNIFVSTNIILMFILVSITSIPALLFNEQIAYLAFGQEDLGLYMVLGILMFVAETTGNNAENYILIRQKSILYSLLAISKLVTSLSLSIYFIVFLKMGVLGYLLADFTTSSVFSLIKHGYVFINVGFNFNVHDMKSILRFSLPIVPAYMFFFIKNNADRIILRNFLGLTQLGVYHMLLKFVTLIVVFITEPFMKSWDIKRFEVCDNPDAKYFMSRMFTYYMALLMTLGLILSLVIPILLRVLTPNEFWISGNITLIAVFSRIVLDAYPHFSFGILYSKLTYKISIIQFISALTSIVLSYVLIKNYGLIGAVTSSLLVNIIQCTIAYILAKKHYIIPFEWCKLLVMCLLMITSFFLINQVSLEKLDYGKNLFEALSGALLFVLCEFKAFEIANGVDVASLTIKIALIVEAFIKFLLSCSFFIMLPFLGIVPKGIFAIKKS